LVQKASAFFQVAFDGVGIGRDATCVFRGNILLQATHRRAIRFHPALIVAFALREYDTCNEKGG